MGVAEDREAVRCHLEAAFDRLDAGGRALPRQPVDQIEIDPTDAGLAQLGDHGGGLPDALDPVDRALDVRIEALHAQAGAVDPGLAQRLDHRRREMARVDLDGDLGLSVECKALAKQCDESDEIRWRQNGRRAAAEMDMADVERRPQMRRDRFDLLPQHGEIGADRRVAQRDRGVAAAIPAHRAAEGDVEVERALRIGGQRREPVAIAIAVDLGREMRRRRIARVARQTFVEISRPRRLHGRFPLRRSTRLRAEP